MNDVAVRIVCSAFGAALVVTMAGCHGSSSPGMDAGVHRVDAHPRRDATSPPHDAALKKHDATPPKVDAYTKPAPVDVLTQHNDSARTGQNLAEAVLTTSNVNVNQFGKLWSLPVQGLVYAQPLLVTGLAIAGTVHDVLLVATMHNVVYAFDANSSGAPLWTQSLGPSVPHEVIAVPCVGDGGTPNIQVEVGILSTPVIDRETSRVYLTNKTYVNQVQQLWIHALDLTTGLDLPGSPIEMTATVPGNPYDGGTTSSLEAPLHAQRPSLLLLNGVVYVAFASHEDCGAYHGWILGYRYDDDAATLTQTAALDLSTDGIQAGIWQSGQGLLSDGTSIYGVTSNGSLTAQNGGGSYGECFLKLTPGLSVTDWFAPVGFDGLNVADNDLGSGGPVLLPGTVPPLIMSGGKGGILYVVDMANMGHLGNGVDDVVQEWQAVYGGIFGGLAAWTGGGDLRAYVWPEGDYLEAFVFSNGLFAMTPAVTSAPNANVSSPGQDPTGILAVTSNGTKPGTGIVWASKPLDTPDHSTVPGTLYAFDALTLRELWDSKENAARDDYGSYPKFVPPTVANGKVYMATHSQQVVVYGLLGDAGLK